MGPLPARSWSFPENIPPISERGSFGHRARKRRLPSIRFGRLPGENPGGCKHLQVRVLRHRAPDSGAGPPAAWDYHTGFHKLRGAEIHRERPAGRAGAFRHIQRDGDYHKETSGDADARIAQESRFRCEVTSPSLQCHIRQRLTSERSRQGLYI